MIVDKGKIIEKDGLPSGVDHRLDIYKEKKTHSMPGGHVYGFFAACKDILYKVNGYDEITSGSGGEDYNIGIRIEKMGENLYYNSNCIIYQMDKNLINENSIYMGIDPLIDKDLYYSTLEKYNIRCRISHNRYDISHLILDITLKSREYWTIGNDYNIEELNKKEVKDFKIDFPKDLKRLDGVDLLGT